MNPYLDHIIWACADLEHGSRRFEALTGVHPRYGGVHASGLTHTRSWIWETGAISRFWRRSDPRDPATIAGVGLPAARRSPAY